MKPLKLTMSAWGPYPEQIEIDFARFYEGSLFLITGPTGAGKTTVFDAISFALYGDVSGKIREKSSVRSDFAKHEMDTYVELTFSHKNEIYTIKRMPKYERPKKRGTGTTISNETAELYIQEQTPITVIANVNKKVEEILGINYAQFKQIAMIAQGEFLEVLVSNSKDRVEIFRNLFQTGQYEKLQKILSVKANKLYQNSSELKNKIEEAIASINVVENDELSTLLESEHFQYEKIVELTKEYVKEEKGKILTYEKELLCAEERTKEQIIILTEGEALNLKIEELERLKNEINALEADKDRINKEEEKIKKAYASNKVALDERLYLDAKIRVKELTGQLESYQEEIEKLNPEYEASRISLKENEIRNEKIEEYQNKYRKLEELVPLFLELEKIEQSLRQYQENITSLLKHQESINEKQQKCISKKQDLSEEIKALTDVEENISENKLKILKQERIYMDMKEAVSKCGDLKNQKKELKKVQDIYELSEKEFKIKKEIFEKSEELYKKAAVGLAARYLKENMPCPVCGSLDHPKKAMISDDIPDEEQINELKKAYEESAETTNRYYLIAAKQNGIVLGKENELNALLTQLHIDSLTNLTSQIEVMKKELDFLYEERKRLDVAIERKVNFLNQITEIDTISESLFKEKESILIQYQEVKSKLDLLQGKKDQIIVKLPKDVTSLDVKNEMETIKDELEHFKQINKQVEDTYLELKTKLENNKTLYEDTKIRYNIMTNEEKSMMNKYLESMALNGFVSEEEYLTAKLSEEELKRLEKSVKDYTEIRKMKLEKKRNLETDIKDRERVDTDSLKLFLTDLENQKTKMRKEKEEISARIIGNKRALDSIQAKLLMKKKIDDEYGIVKDLDNVTKGNNKDRLVFEQYVLASYFEEIVASANLRLSKMTNSRYELMKVSKVADARTKDSLDLEVLDHYTGKIRSIKTLSGGESFKAALSLALGLSDIVQNNAGGIEIETLFIDEGFGSLDSESLDQALNTLISLTEQNRLIGIISHVNDLKERIDHQITIEKGNNGSKLKLVY